MPNYQDEGYINKLLKEAEGASPGEISCILDKAARFEGLTPFEVAALLSTNSRELRARLFEVAFSIKKHIYGDRIVMFAPLYVSDYCVNGCLYCGFRCGHDYKRRRLTMDEVRREAELLERMGHKRLAVEAGEDPENCPLSYILEVIKTLYETKTGSGGRGDSQSGGYGEIRRVNVNIAATTVDEYRQLKDAGIGTYILFQETYHQPTYEKMHPSGPKSDYRWHTEAFDRAMEAGVEDVGGGVLFGLYDWRYEVLALMLHNEHLEQKFGVGFHTISLPRIRHAEGATLGKWRNAVTDSDFLLLTAILRLAVPYTGMIISTRETKEMRKDLIRCGVSQMSGGSTVEVGGYSLRERKAAQFSVQDERTPQEILLWLMDEDLIPSFCTACYRKGRTGDRFMSLAKSGQIKNVCLPNALMTLAEYARDYGSPAFKEKSAKLISRKTDGIPDENIRAEVRGNIERISGGASDLYL
ncbi:MAG: [FeFe] hydrogenase H-cluster radical SAM maturase HydG [Clostridiales bacterium]|nr:[FeFe] hydrogenase H-cluster radical SAM maturase HydG [Clostridiales bacterium]